MIKFLLNRDRCLGKTDDAKLREDGKRHQTSVIISDDRRSLTVQKLTRF